MNALNQLRAFIVAEFAGNARLRWGVWLILGIALLHCIVVQSDRVAAAHDEYARESGRLAKAGLLLERRDWPELLEAERKTYRDLTGTFWQAETEGVAQAKLQAALAEMVEDLDLRNLHVRSGVSQPVPDLPGILRVETRLDAGYRQGVELQMLHAVATYPNRLFVERLDLSRRERLDSYVALILSAYFVGVEAERQ